MTRNHRPESGGHQPAPPLRNRSSPIPETVTGQSRPAEDRTARALRAPLAAGLNPPLHRALRRAVPPPSPGPHHSPGPPPNWPGADTGRPTAPAAAGVSDQRRAGTGGADRAPQHRVKVQPVLLVQGSPTSAGPAQADQARFSTLQPREREPQYKIIGGGTFSGKGGHPKSGMNRGNFQGSNYLPLCIHPKYTYF